MPVQYIADLLLAGIQTTYDAEQQFARCLANLQQLASDARLRLVLGDHLNETNEQIENLEEIFTMLARQPRGQPSAVTGGLIAELRSNLSQAAGTAELVDLVIAATFAKIEHVEVATYQSLVHMARATGKSDVMLLLETNLGQETRAIARIHDAMSGLIQRAIDREREQAA